MVGFLICYEDMNMAKRPDWEAIESAYRAGVMSLREIASQHGISEGATRQYHLRHFSNLLRALITPNNSVSCTKINVLSKVASRHFGCN